jgi:hypothetical protein
MAGEPDNGNGGENNNWKDTLPQGVNAYVKLIDKDWDDFTIDVPNATTEKVNGYILHQIIHYRSSFYTDYKLWECFREDFEDWTLNTWKLGSTRVVRELRDFLRRNGVYVIKNGTLIANNIHNIITNPEEPTWTQEEIQKQMNNEPNTNLFSNEGNFNSKRNPLRKPNSIHIPPLGDSSNDGKDKDLPAGEIPSREVTNLMKIYQDEEKKFGGELYDILGTKLQVFQDCCNKVGIQRHQYHHAFSVMLKGRAATFYYDHIAGKRHDFDTMLQLTKAHFETDENRQLYMSEWREATFQRVINSNPTKSRLECLQILFDKLQKVQRGLTESYQNDNSLRDQVISACRGIPECSLALYQPADTFEGVCAQLRSAVGTAVRTQEPQPQPQQFYTNSPTPAQYNQNWTDRTYGGRGKDNYRGRGSYNNFRGNSFQSNNLKGNNFQGDRPNKKCYVCGKPGCWSTKHTLDERKQAYNKFSQYATCIHQEPTTAYYQSFLTQWEGIEDLTEDNEQGQVEQLLAEMEIGNEEFCDFDNYVTEFGEVNRPETIAILNNQSVFHSVTKTDIFKLPAKSSTFTFDNRYSSETFQGIMPDSGAAGVSTAGQLQFIALQKLDPVLQINTTTAGQHKIRFGKGEALSQGTIDVLTPLGIITFHVVPTNTPFLFCLQDIDRLGVKLDNLANVLIQGEKIIPIVRKWGHPWMLLHHPEEVLAWCHLTETELRQLHRRFGHPSIRRLTRVLERAGHEVEQKAIERLTKYCHQCQMNSKAPGRFKFTLKDDYEFNWCIIVDVMYLDGKPVLHVVDEATAFQAAKFLKDMSAKTTWDTLRICWIDVYQGPPDIIVTDAGKNFASEEFRQHAATMDISIKEVPVEAHNSIGKVERYHSPLRRAFEILSKELPSLAKDLVLQMAVKAVNDSAGLDGIVPTLLVFGAYPRMTKDSPPSPSITERAEATHKAMKEIRHLYAKRQINDALAMRNGPNTEPLLSLPLQSDIRVWREKDGWDGPYKLLAMDGQTCTIQMPYGPANFRSTVVKPYCAEEMNKTAYDTLSDITITINHPEEDTNKVDHLAKRGRGRPKGSKNKQYLTALDSFLSNKEKGDLELSLKLRRDGIITDPGLPFQASDKKEIDGLVARGVFSFEQFDESKHGKERIFKSRIVREVKGKATPTPFEKSRLVIQAYNDYGKEVILTQSPTIQRASQRLIIALTPSLIKLGMTLWIRDITQAYTQSSTLLQRKILAYLPKEIEDLYPKDTIMVVLKPLYGIPEAGTHWWATYFKHHQEKLHMTTSTYDPCLLITTTKEEFAVVGMQTDDTLGLSDNHFAILEQDELDKAKFTAKPKEILTTTNQLQFNGCILSLENGGRMTLRQKEQGRRIQLINNTTDFRQGYIEQRARGAYIASICQPEATFDLSVAAQHQEPVESDVNTLNKRLDWQMKNMDRGLTYVDLDLLSAKLYVFVDGSFANNKDLSSQIGFELILANETIGDDEFTIYGNLIHWSSTKSKRITRSVLASEIYGMVAGTDIGFAIGSTLKMITEQLNLPTIPTIVCTDSFSLYECLVKLGTTKEKRLMIDIMAIRQSYERRELFEIRWINGLDNPADAMTKATPNKALETFVSTNQIRVRVEGWVKREEQSRTLDTTKRGHKDVPFQQKKELLV